MVLAAVLVAGGAWADIPGLVEIVSDKPAAVMTTTPPGARPVPFTGYVALRGSTVPPMGAEQVDVRTPWALSAAFACRTPGKVKVTAAVEWGDGARGEAAVTPEKTAPAWLVVPSTLTSVAASDVFYGRLAATHAYASADLYTVRVTLQVTSDAGAMSSFVRTQRVRVRDAALAQQPWLFDLEGLSLLCADGQPCAFPLALDSRVTAQARFRFGPAWQSGQTARWEWGDGVASAGQVTGSGGLGRVMGPHTYMKGGKYPLRLTVTGRYKDGSTDSRVQTLDLIVADVAIDDIAAPPGGIPKGLPAEFQTSYRYTDAQRQRKATWAWGDGTSTAGQLSERSGVGSVFAQHSFAKAGLYKVTLTIADGQSETSASASVTVSAPGSVNASGALACPAGVFVGNAKATGPARLELNARHDGAAPSGTFRLTANGFDFQSEQITTLAISGTQATASGTGTFNGQRPFSFDVDVWATPAADGRPAQKWARVRITDQAKQKGVFDNDVFDGALQPMADGRVDIGAH
jgi:PKD repeat protein